MTSRASWFLAAVLTVSAGLCCAAGPTSSPVAATATAGPVAIGYVDTELVLQGSLEFKEIDREARSKIDLKEEEGQQKLEAIRKLEEELSVMSEDQRKARLAEYNRKRQELVDFQAQSRDEILERQSVDLKRIANKIRAIIEQIGRDQQFTVILDVKPILYLNASKVVDLTERVTQLLNAEYLKEKDKMQRKLPTRVQ
jgi:Skp family chaperone for outer membrane proteins